MGKKVSLRGHAQERKGETGRKNKDRKEEPYDK
jgi:hypothetical protein